MVDLLHIKWYIIMQKRRIIMRKFDYSFLDNGLLPANLISITGSIYSLRTAAGNRKAEYAKVFTELEAVAKVQSVKSSNAIEGIITSIAPISPLYRDFEIFQVTR